MKKAETVIKQIEKLEDELHDNYSAEEIKEAIEKLDKKGKLPRRGNHWIVNTIYEYVSDEGLDW